MSHKHYFRDISKYQEIDVYRLLDVFGVVCPVAQHVVKKAIAAGIWLPASSPLDRKQQSHREAAMSWLEIAVTPLVAVLAPLAAAWADMKATELNEKEASQ